MNGLFDPRREHDACGVGFVAYLDGQSRHDVMHMALGAMTRMAHRGGGDGRNGDGAGILFPLPRDFFLRQWPALSVFAHRDVTLVFHAQTAGRARPAGRPFPRSRRAP